MDIRFYLSPQVGKSGEAQILVSLHTNDVRVKTSTGYKIPPQNWDKTRQRVRRGTQSNVGQAYNTINAALDKISAHFGAIDDVTKHFTKEELAEEYRAYRGMTKHHKSENSASQKEENTTIKAILLKFVTEQGQLNGWSESTFKKFKTLGNHLDAYKKDMATGDIGNETLNGFVSYLLKQGFNNNYVKKLTKTLAWFLRWSNKKGYTEVTVSEFDSLAPHLKTPERLVIYLDWDELMRVYNFQVPETKRYLERVRDVFCFCCFTGIRFSDSQNLKTADVYQDKISISTIKTSERLEIPLTKYARAILDRYTGDDTDGKALPSLPNQKANEHLKELCQLCGIDRPVTVVDFRGSQRIEEVKKKWELIGTHCGRRTFICNALAMGIPVQTVMSITGHSDYQAMKPYIAVAESTKQAAMDVFNNR